jgi:hypothetical protein
MLHYLNFDLQQRNFAPLTRSDLVVLESISLTNQEFQRPIEVDFMENFEELLPLLDAETIDILSKKLGFLFYRTIL